MRKQYKATIITPFHNTDMSLFAETYKSVKAQTIGFENIEWIIVLHNCEQEYVGAVRKLVGEYENVILKELHNDAKSASSPRNYALQFVTSPYLEFLDSDDYINSETIERCIEVMEKHHPDIVVFRMAYVRENDSVHSLITDVTLWNPLEKEVVLTGDGLRCMELYASINLTSHPRFFNMEFLRTNRLSFDEKITMAEDGYFLICAYSNASKIVVLPQFIGHYYYVNDKSAVQSVKKMTPEAILHFSYGFKKIFDRILEMHAYYNYIFLAFLAGYAQNCYESPYFTDKDWETFQSDMAPYAKMVTPPPVNKLYSKEEGMLLYNFVVNSILKPHVQGDKRYHNGKMSLNHALAMNADTDFGRFYHFEDLKTIEAFRSTVPVYEHNDYDELVRLCTEVGEKKLLTCAPIRAYAYDFNESDEKRTVPVSDKMCSVMGRKFVRGIMGETTFLMLESISGMKQLNDGTYYDSYFGIQVRSAIHDYAMSFQGFNAVLTSPVALLFPVKPVRGDYLNLLLALRNPDVTQIYGGNAWVIWNYIELLLTEGEKLCRDIEQGTISVPHEENDMLFEEIKVWNTPNPERAGQIRDALKAENKKQLLCTIWPKLKRMLFRDSGEYRFYENKIRRYIGDLKTGMDELITPYGLLGEREGDERAYKLNTDTNFYEFLDSDKVDESHLKLLTEAEPGKTYEMVLTNGEGIYRMLTNIFVRPTRVNAEGMWFEGCARPIVGGGQVICGGDKLENTLQDSIGDLLYDYFCYYNENKNRLEILVELEKDDLGTDYSETIEKRLMQDEVYRAARNRGLGECRSRMIPKGTHLLWRDIRRESLDVPVDCFPPMHSIRIERVPILEQYMDET